MNEQPQTKLPLIPVKDDLLVRRDRGATKMGSIHLPGEQKSMTGIVVAVGPCVDKATSVCPVGTKVMLRNFGGTPFESGGDEYLVLKEEELLGVIPS